MSSPTSPPPAAHGAPRSLPDDLRPRLARLFVAACTFALAGALAGCASSLPPRHVKLQDLGKSGELAMDRPLIVEIEAGEVIPLELSLAGPFLETPKDAPSIPLRAKRHFYLRIDRSGLKASVDPDDFDKDQAAPGQFQIGLGATKAGPKATIAIRTPTPEGLPVD